MEALNIMVVDDSHISVKKLSKVIEELGHTVVQVARTGKEAVEKYDRVNPDLVTMDITMPDMNGIEATRQIRSKYKDALILMVTSHGQEQMVMDAIEAGAKGYILKPFKKNKLAESIEKMIDRFG
jgi:two-component system chemotaxis response regulator CheY